MSKSLTVDNHTIKFQIWDTAGQERVCVYMYVTTSHVCKGSSISILIMVVESIFSIQLSPSRPPLLPPTVPVFTAHVLQKCCSSRSSV